MTNEAWLKIAMTVLTGMTIDNVLMEKCNLCQSGLLLLEFKPPSSICEILSAIMVAGIDELLHHILQNFSLGPDNHVGEKRSRNNAGRAALCAACLVQKAWLLPALKALHRVIVIEPDSMDNSLIDKIVHSQRNEAWEKGRGMGFFTKALYICQQEDPVRENMVTMMMQMPHLEGAYVGDAYGAWSLSVSHLLSLASPHLSHIKQLQFKHLVSHVTDLIELKNNLSNHPDAIHLDICLVVGHFFCTSADFEQAQAIDCITTLEIMSPLETMENGEVQGEDLAPRRRLQDWILSWPLPHLQHIFYAGRDINRTLPDGKALSRHRTLHTLQYAVDVNITIMDWPGIKPIAPQLRNLEVPVQWFWGRFPITFPYVETVTINHFFVRAQRHISNAIQLIIALDMLLDKAYYPKLTHVVLSNCGAASNANPLAFKVPPEFQPLCDRAQARHLESGVTISSTFAHLHFALTH
ncbi:hypothetical protein DFH11DRAFT_1552274 [Phellopilus nigrolimitatus]|nr:hypothetical protein DFH11DRAFT_1552274 [Phellopilus nigrolimitatus]